MKYKAVHWSDADLEREIVRLQQEIQAWAEARGLWRDAGFKSYLDHVDGELPNLPVVTLLLHEGHFYGERRGFGRMLSKSGYWYDNLSGTSIEIYPKKDAPISAFADYFHWQWVCNLIKEDTADVYEELYNHFVRRPDDLHRLDWRQFEILLFRVFQSQGFEAILGPGRGDNGVDLKLWHRDPIGDVITVVQAKRYAPGNKVDLTQVAALYGIANIERTNNALFVTTSSYLPVARRFAARTAGSLQLADRADVVNWCARATGGVIADKSTLVAPASVSRLIAQVAGRKDPRVLHAHWGDGMLLNDFALVIKETRHAALLMRLPACIVADDGYGQRGIEVPLLDGTTISQLNGEMVWSAKRKMDGSCVRYWDGSRSYTAWSGEPEYFDSAD